MKNQTNRKQKKVIEQPEEMRVPGGRVSLAGGRASAKAPRCECVCCVYRMARELLFMLLSLVHVPFPAALLGEFLVSLQAQLFSLGQGAHPGMVCLHLSSPCRIEIPWGQGSCLSGSSLGERALDDCLPHVLLNERMSLLSPLSPVCLISASSFLHPSRPYIRLYSLRITL